MNELRSVGFIVLSMGLAAACGPSPEPGPQCPSTEEAVQSAVDRLMAADSAGDLDAALAMYAEQVVWLPPNGETVSGLAAIAERYQTMFDENDVSVAAHVDVIQVDGGFASVQGETVGELRPVAGGDPIPIDDAFLMLMECEPDAHWRISHLAWSHRERVAADDAADGNEPAAMTP